VCEMALLQRRKGMGGLAAIWDTVVRPDARLNVSGSNYIPARTAGNSRKIHSGGLRFWKRVGWKFYPLKVLFLIPTCPIPDKGFPVTVFCQTHPGSTDKEWDDFTVQCCLQGSVVIIVELPASGATPKQQARAFLEAVWRTLVRKVGGLADSPARLAWWGPGNAAAVVEHAARMRGNKYYLPPLTVLTRPFNQVVPARDFAGLAPVEIQAWN
jgi:hypothetical protein